MYHRSLRRAGFVFLMCFVLLGLLVPATVSAAPAQPDKQSTAAQEGYGGFYYTVRPGDNLTRIAARYGTTVARDHERQWAVQLSHLCGPGALYPSGPVVVAVAAAVGVPRRTLCSRATRCPALPAGLASAHSNWPAANNIYNPSHIYVGQRLCIPSGGGQPYPPPHRRPHPAPLVRVGSTTPYSGVTR